MQPETNRTIINDKINGELERLIGRMKILDELCEVEEDQLFYGEQSLTNECNVLKCSIKPIAHKVAQYVSSVYIIINFYPNFLQLLDERCGCGEGCYYVPGKYIEYDGAKDLTHLSNVLHNAVNFLQIILSDVVITEECRNDDGVGDSTIQEGSATMEALEPEGKLMV